MGGDGDRFSNQHIINLFGECFTWHRAIFSGGYPPNIVAADAFHNRVRDGSEWDHTAMDTRIDKHSQGMNPENCIGSAANAARLNQQRMCVYRQEPKCWSSPRSISTPPLHPLLDFHVEPINGCSSRDLTGLPHGNTHLEVGFPLRCFQRLSTPHMATQRLPLAR